ncbi:LysR family transcriptional regulator [Serratia sp. P2ACOL2]|uniref:LysR family transcriptional regulator n=1 Tax=Serratia sp. P2ACOL2 TaxID=2482769 RepID=UPI001EE3C645|nr:LysR family transcriptional regulator [Serratia sp. P2ACOL2]
MNQRLSIDALRALQSVIDTGSMTRAAKQLNLSQSAVSWKIKRLEEQLGRTLIDRQGGALIATVDGEALLMHGRQILQAHDRALAHFSPLVIAGDSAFWRHRADVAVPVGHLVGDLYPSTSAG